MSSFQTQIEHKLNSKIEEIKACSGGCIAKSYLATLTDGRKLFIKSGVSHKDSFEKEYNGLLELKKSNTIASATPIYFDSDILVLEAIEESAIKDNFWRKFAIQLANLHQYTATDFGFYENNYIGNTPQINLNPRKLNWEDFYWENRLLYQIRLAEDSNLLTSEFIQTFSKFENRYPKIIHSDKESPSLIHGDLWSGNFLCGKNGEAYLIDPAVYYGHREIELAMCKLFGGFDATFYKAYQDYYPLSEGANYRENLYKLYHILNHINLFGKSYHNQALYILKNYLK